MKVRLVILLVVLIAVIVYVATKGPRTTDVVISLLPIIFSSCCIYRAQKKRYGKHTIPLIFYLWIKG